MADFFAADWLADLLAEAHAVDGLAACFVTGFVGCFVDCFADRFVDLSAVDFLAGIMWVRWCGLIGSGKEYQNFQ